MNQRTGFYRKVAYLGGMCALLLPMYWLSSPRTAKDPGGVLARMRDEHELGQVDLGEIDPASETMKLATLGLRGVAVNLLWGQADEYKKTENWSKLTATLDQLAKLQPNFVTFWKFQSWNQSYNLSVEFDDYRDRYYYVRRGIEFLEKGDRYNRDNPQLLWELGWFLGYKIGRADEKVQYRRLFKADDEYHDPRDRPPGDGRDNWLVGKEWYEESVVAADEKGRGIGRKSPLVFYSSAPKWQMNYAEAIETEGLFEKARAAWARGESEWRDFGALEVQHSLGGTVYLNSQERLEEEVGQLQSALNAVSPGAADALGESLLAELSDEERAVLAMPERDRTDDEATLAYNAERKLRYQPRQLAEWIGAKTPDLRREAVQAAAALEAKELRLRYTRNYKDTANYDYWLTRCRFEQSDDAVEARKQLYQGRKVFRDERKPEEAKVLYEKGLASWRRVLDAYPVLMDPDGTTGDDVFEFVKQYNRVLQQLEESIPEDFPLWDVIEQFDLEGELRRELAEHLERVGGRAGPPPVDEEPQEPAEADAEEPASGE